MSLSKSNSIPIEVTDLKLEISTIHSSMGEALNLKYSRRSPNKIYKIIYS
jgi:hypothetical protein